MVDSRDFERSAESNGEKGNALESLDDRPALPGVSLSLVIPAYNEDHRIVATLDEVASHVATEHPGAEIILVDDGSTDQTLERSRAFAEDHPTVIVVSIPHGGKAAAVRSGMQAATGVLIAFFDADLATPLTHLRDLVVAASGDCDVVIGSREGTGARRIGEPMYRHVMGRGFNWLVRVVALPGIADTQCGFKLFRREAAVAIFSRTLLYPAEAPAISGPRVTAFDVELLVVARRLGLRVCTVPVTWRYGTHSKVDPARDTWNNFLDVIKVKYNDLRGRYR